MRFAKINDIKYAYDLTQLLHRAYRADELLQIHFKAASIRLDQVVDHLLTTPTFALLDEENNILATASVRLPWSSDPGPFSLPHIGWVAVDPDSQHQGLAKEVITQVIQRFIQAQLQAPAVSLGTALEHPWLKKAYQKLGFQPVDTIRKFPDHQTVYMVKVFDSKNTFKINDSYLQSVI